MLHAITTTRQLAYKAQQQIGKGRSAPESCRRSSDTVICLLEVANRTPRASGRAVAYWLCDQLSDRPYSCQLVTYEPLKNHLNTHQGNGDYYSSA